MRSMGSQVSNFEGISSKEKEPIHYSDCADVQTDFNLHCTQYEFVPYARHWLKSSIDGHLAKLWNGSKSLYDFCFYP